MDVAQQPLHQRALDEIRQRDALGCRSGDHPNASLGRSASLAFFNCSSSRRTNIASPGESAARHRSLVAAFAAPASRVTGNPSIDTRSSAPPSTR
jgi:hypothetical protein